MAGNVGGNMRIGRIEKGQFKIGDKDHVVFFTKSEVLGEVKVEISPSQKYQALLSLEATESKVKSCLLSAIGGHPQFVGGFGSPVKATEQESKQQYKRSRSKLPSSFPLHYGVEGKIQELETKYKMVVCYEAHRPNRSNLDPMPFGGYSATNTVQQEWERIKSLPDYKFSVENQISTEKNIMSVFESA